MASARGQTTATGSHTATAILLVTAGIFCITVNDALVKWLGEHYPIVQVAFFRMLFALPLVLGVAFLTVGRGALVTHRPLFHMGRGLLAALAVYSFYFALTLMPLAEVTAITFAAPLFITLLALPMLGERPGIGQWLATLVGFLGVLLIIRPGTATFTFAALVPLVTALAYALFMLTARMMQQGERLWTTMFYATIVPLVISALMLPWFWQTPAPEHMLFFVGCGVFGGMGIALITQGFRVGRASTIAPFEYTGMIWAVLFGWIFWTEIPSALTIAGALLIAGCGIHLAWRHGRNRRRDAPGQAHPPA